MIRTIAAKEIKNLFREKKFWLVVITLLLLLVVASFTDAINLKAVNKQKNEAQIINREEWLHQNPKNPHRGAHFGNFAFRLKTSLSLFDNGLNNYTGSQVYLEPHKQDDFNLSSAEDADSLIRFGELTPAFILQTILPLLLIFLCFAAVSKEKEDSTIKLLIISGANMQQIVAGKILGNWLPVSVLITLLCFASVLFMPAAQTSEADIIPRFTLLCLNYILYAGIIIIICIVVSAFSKTSKASLMKLLSLWMLSCIIIPKICSNVGSTLYATPSQFQYATLVKHDEENGLDGHDPNDKRRAVLMQAVLKKYHVDTVTKLPVNFDAIAMIESEKYTTAVFRKRIAEVRNIFKKQDNISLYASFINPFLATQFTSMALCGSDYLHYIHFQDSAESYRLYFVNTMNTFMASHTKSGDFDTKFGQDTYKIIKPYIYAEPSLAWSVQQQPVSFIAMLTWFIFCLLLIMSTQKISIV